MFKQVLNSQERELLAYWIFINGLIRLSNRTDWIVIALSYVVEAGVFTYELVVGKVYADKALFVIVISLLFAYLCLAKN
jgi:succinate-acetate transporter protein